MLDILHLEAGGLDRTERVAVRVAASAEEAPQPIQKVLPPSEARIRRSHVFEEQQPTSGFRTRRASASAAPTSGTEHSTSDMTTASTEHPVQAGPPRPTG